MAFDTVAEWNTTPALNTEIAGFPISDASLPNTLDNWQQNSMAQIRTLFTDPDGFLEVEFGGTGVGTITDLLTALGLSGAVKDIAFADSPYTVLEADRGTLFNIDATNGAVVMNLLSIAAVDNAYVNLFRRVDGVIANAITINRDGTDTIAPSLTSIALDNINQAVALHAGNATEWIRQSDFSDLVNSGYRTISGTGTLTVADNNFLIDCTASLTINFHTAAVLGDKFVCHIKADGGDVTLDPNGSETVDGNLSIIVSDGYTARVVCDGTNFHTTGSAVTLVPLFTSEFLSAAQTIATAESRTIAHGLGAIPKLINTYLECQTAQYGYSVGDELQINAATDIGLNGLSMTLDATNIFIRYSSESPVFTSLNKTTGDNVSLTDSNWRLYVRAIL